ncbi:MAG: leucyl aminopeptidase, partial [Betaproteobacteria bacterium]
MDFKSVALGPSGLSALSADALLVVVAGTAMPADVEAPVAALLRDAVKGGDLELKAGRTLYVHRPAGLKAQRLVLAVAADDSAKSFKAAVAAGLSAVKGLGVAHLAVAQVGTARITEAHAEALAAAVA